jgi:predicted nuclease of predicted toxin-antitoxin system
VARLGLNLRRASDAVVLTTAVRQQRILVTLDTDFGTLVFLHQRKAPPAVVLIRLTPPQLAERLNAVADAVGALTEPGGVFVVIDAQGVRIRPLPGG